ncbi:MAG: taurine transport system permease protein [Clostridiales bacterium]|jgi:taurine transport system permease protein|nr:taurine transport system permease protein [Clostridiales bacterium]
MKQRINKKEPMEPTVKIPPTGFRQRHTVLLTFVTWVVILIIWISITASGLVSPVMVPSPMSVLETFAGMIREGYNGISLFSHLGISFLRLFAAFLLAAGTGIPLGLLSGYFRPVRAVVDSIVQFYRPLPPLAYYTLLILWLGIDESSKITLLFLAALAPIYVSCVSAVGRVNRNYLLSARSLGANSQQVFRHIVLPACLPEIFTGLRTAIGVAYTTLVASEMVAATSGIGWLVIDASRYLRSNVMFVGIIIMGITGVLIDMLMRVLERKLVYWGGY